MFWFFSKRQRELEIEQRRIRAELEQIKHDAIARGVLQNEMYLMMKERNDATDD